MFGLFDRWHVAHRSIICTTIKSCLSVGSSAFKFVCQLFCKNFCTANTLPQLLEQLLEDIRIKNKMPPIVDNSANAADDSSNATPGHVLNPRLRPQRLFQKIEVAMHIAKKKIMDNNQITIAE